MSRVLKDFQFSTGNATSNLFATGNGRYIVMSSDDDKRWSLRRSLLEISSLHRGGRSFSLPQFLGADLVRQIVACSH